jgi:hypothetical protein
MLFTCPFPSFLTWTMQSLLYSSSFWRNCLKSDCRKRQKEVSPFQGNFIVTSLQRSFDIMQFIKTLGWNSKRNAQHNGMYFNRLAFNWISVINLISYKRSSSGAANGSCKCNIKKMEEYTTCKNPLHLGYCDMRRVSSTGNWSLSWARWIQPISFSPNSLRSNLILYSTQQIGLAVTL